MSFFMSTQRGLEHVTQPIGDFSTIHNQPSRSHLPLSSLEGYPHQGMSALSTSTSFPTFSDDYMPHTLPKLGETRCYWSLLSSELDFIYLDPAFASHLESQADLFIGKSLLSFVHPEEQATARADLAEALEHRTMHGSVTRVRYCRLPHIRRILGHQGPSQPWPDGDKVSVDAYYMVVDIVINWAAEGLVLCFIHAVVDLEPGDNDEHHKTPWTNWCGTPSMRPEQITLLHQRLLYYYPQLTTATRVFQILSNSNCSQQESRLLLSWPPDSSQEYPGMTGTKDFAKRAAGIQTSTRDNSAKTSCTRRWRIQDTMPGLGEVESVFIPHGSITFACHTIQQPASRSSYSQPQPFTRSADAYMPAHSPQHPYDLSASPYTLPPVSTSMPQSYGQYTSSLPSQYSQSHWGSYSEPSSSLSQFNRWPTESPGQSMTPLPSSSCTVREPSYSRPSPSPIYGESRASFSSYQSTPSPEMDYTAKGGFEGSMPSGLPGTDIVPPPRHRVSPGTHKDTLARPNNNRPVGILKCSSCKATSSPEWRKGPSGKKELCNACGLRFARSRAKKEGNTHGPQQRRKKEKYVAVTTKEECVLPSTPPIAITGAASANRRSDLEGTSFDSTSPVGSGSGSEAYSQSSPVAPDDHRPSPSPLSFVHYHVSQPTSGLSHHQPRIDGRPFPYHTGSPFQPSPSPLSSGHLTHRPPRGQDNVPGSSRSGFNHHYPSPSSNSANFERVKMEDRNLSSLPPSPERSRYEAFR